jgi:hypothetical protein
MGDEEVNANLVPRLCHIVRWSDFQGYGFNLHAEKGKAGQFIGKVDEGSPAEAAGLKQGDRIVAVNGVSIGNENHQQVVSRIKLGGEETRLLVVDAETDALYRDQKKIVTIDLPEVVFLSAARDEGKFPTLPFFYCLLTQKVPLLYVRQEPYLSEYTRHLSPILLTCFRVCSDQTDQLRRSLVCLRSGFRLVA